MRYTPVNRPDAEQRRALGFDPECPICKGGGLAPKTLKQCDHAYLAIEAQYYTGWTATGILIGLVWAAAWSVIGPLVFLAWWLS